MLLKLFSLKSLVILLGAVLIGILYFGLGPQSLGFPNGVEWLSDRPGIRFSEYGIAYTSPYVETELVGKDVTSNFTIEIVLAPAVLDGDGFSFVWVIHSGRDSDQLVMGQYRSWFIIMNGDDYNHSRKIKRISAIAALRPHEKHFVTITVGPEGSRIYIDGRLDKTKNDLSLKIPVGDKVRLVVGNSISVKHSWRGDIFGMAIYPHTLSESEVALHFGKWTRSQNFSFAEKDNPSILYIFDEKTGTMAIDHSGGDRPLHILPTAKVLKRQFLVPPRGGRNLKKWNINDIVINLLGFIPLGFVLSATLDKIGGIFRKRTAFLTAMACFAVSLFIETVQTTIPSRNSDLLDLVFNTAGGLIGAVVYLMLKRRFSTALGP